MDKNATLRTVLTCMIVGVFVVVGVWVVAYHQGEVHEARCVVTELSC